MKITNEILEGQLNCKFKGHLKLAGEVGTRSDYEAMTTAARATSREQAITKLVARSGVKGRRLASSARWTRNASFSSSSTTRTRGAAVAIVLTVSRRPRGPAPAK